MLLPRPTRCGTTAWGGSEMNRIAPWQGDRRKVILSTNVAESSDHRWGVAVVIPGWRESGHSPWSVYPTEHRRSSRASAIESRRAGRTRRDSVWFLYASRFRVTRAVRVPEVMQRIWQVPCSTARRWSYRSRASNGTRSHLRPHFTPLIFAA